MGKFKTKSLAARQFISTLQGALIVCRKRRASAQEKTMHQMFTLSKLRCQRSHSSAGSKGKRTARKQRYELELYTWTGFVPGQPPVVKSCYDKEPRDTALVFVGSWEKAPIPTLSA